MNPVAFSIMLIMNLVIGFYALTYGINLFVSSSISKVPIRVYIKTNNRDDFILSCSVVIICFCKIYNYGIFMN